MASRKLTDLDLELAPICEKFIAECAVQSIEILITCTYRSEQEQSALYEQGRTTGGRIVTHAKAGQSLHNRAINGKPASLAFDVVPIINGRCVWATQGEAAHLWQRIAKIGKALGLTWGGDWSGSKCDPAHFQLGN
jgi:peptidoglycan LD-endopeptidase CwlK